MDLQVLKSFLLVGAAATIPVLTARLFLLRKHIATLESDCDSVEKRLHDQSLLLRKYVAMARDVSQRYEALKVSLTEDGVVETWLQPVLLVGPRAVGKTSLLALWKSPWAVQAGGQSPTFRHNYADVSVCELRAIETRPHRADPSLVTPIHAHVMLRVHDFAGELNAQRLVEKIVVDETRKLQECSRRNLGVVVVCMFDASEAVSGISEETRRYYTGELFGRLRNLVFTSKARIERLILVFNKLDRLRETCPHPHSDAQLLDECFRYFLSSFAELSAICNHERVRAVLTVLNTLTPESVRGAPAVLGEAARPLIEALNASEAARHILDERGYEAPERFFLRSIDEGDRTEAEVGAL